MLFSGDRSSWATLAPMVARERRRGGNAAGRDFMQPAMITQVEWAGARACSSRIPYSRRRL